VAGPARVSLRAVLLFGVLALFVLVMRSATESDSTSFRPLAVVGTVVCGNVSTQTWTAVGSPYVICDSGAHVTAGNVLTIDASLGSVAVEGTSPYYGLTVDGSASLRSLGTGGRNRIAFSPMSVTGTWDSLGVAGTAALSGTDFDRATARIAGPTNFVDVTFTGVGCRAIVQYDGTLDMQGGLIRSTATSCSADVPDNAAIAVHGGSGVNVDGVTIEDAPGPAIAVQDNYALPATTLTRLSIHHCGFGGTPALLVWGDRFGPTTQQAEPVVTDNTITGSGAGGQPAIRLAGATLAPATHIAGNLLGGNSLDAIALDGVGLEGSFDWQTPQPATAAAPKPAGWYVAGGVGVAPGGVMTVPAGGVVKSASSIRFDRSALVARNAVFTSLRDNSVGPPLCPSVDVYAACTPAYGDWDGIQATDSSTDPTAEAALTLDGVTVRYAAQAITTSTWHATGGPTPSLTVAHSTISDAYCGIAALGTPATVTDTTISRMHAAYNGTSPPSTFCTFTPYPGDVAGQGIYATGTLVVDGDVFTDIDRQAVMGPNSAGDYTVANSRFDHVGTSGYSAIHVRGSTIDLHDDVITDSGHGSTRLGSAVTVAGYHGNPADAVRAVTGGGNAIDGILLESARLAGDITWPPATNSAAVHELGWLGDYVRADGLGTVTIPAGGNLTLAGPFDLYGESLDASAGDASFVADPSLPAASVDLDSDRESVSFVASGPIGVVPIRLYPGTDGRTGYVSIAHARSEVGPIDQGVSPRSSPSGPSLVITDTAGPVDSVHAVAGDVAVARSTLAGITTAGADVTLDGAALVFPSSIAHLDALRTATIDVRGTSAPEIDVVNAIDPRITNNEANTVLLVNSTVDVAADVTGNVAATADARGIWFNGVTLDADLTWQQRERAVAHVTPLGYLLSTGGLTVPPGTTLTVPSGAYVQAASGGFTVEGHLISVGGHFLATDNPAAPAPLCSWCYAPNDRSVWDGIVAARAPDGTPGVVTLIGGDIQDAISDVFGYGGSVSVTCVTLHPSRKIWNMYHFASLYIERGSVSVERSNVLGDVNTTPPIDMTYDWWGQPGGPASGQVTGPADASHPLSAPSDCAPPDPNYVPPPTAPAPALDSTAPQVAVPPLSPFALTGAITLSYGATDADSGVASYDVGWRTAASMGGWTAWLYPSTWQYTTRTSVSLVVRAGHEYCFEVRARDHAGNVSPWTSRCTTMPVATAR